MATEAVLKALRQLWEVLSQAGVPAAVAGGLALAAWKHPRTTYDVDVLLIADGAALTDLVGRLLRAGFTRKGKPVVDFGDLHLVQFTIEPEDALVDVQVDLLLAKSNYARESLARSVSLGKEAIGFEIKVLACEDLVLLKLLSGRMIDLADAAALIRVNEVDEQLIVRLAGQLGLSSELEKVSREARS